VFPFLCAPFPISTHFLISHFLFPVPGFTNTPYSIPSLAWPDQNRRLSLKKGKKTVWPRETRLTPRPAMGATGSMLSPLQAVTILVVVIVFSVLCCAIIVGIGASILYMVVILFQLCDYLLTRVLNGAHQGEHQGVREPRESHRVYPVHTLLRRRRHRIYLPLEQCPLENVAITSKRFSHTGGNLTIEGFAVTVTIPEGAINTGHEVEIQGAASLFGPFTIPKGYHPISAYIWIGADYDFKEKLEIEIEHHAHLASTDDITTLCVLKTCETDGHQTLCEASEMRYQYNTGSSFYTYYANHVCALCLATKSISNSKIVVFHCLPEDYKSSDDFTAEVCFCYDLKPCRKRTEQQYLDRNMKIDTLIRTNIVINDDDEVLLSDPSVGIGNDDWSCTVQNPMPKTIKDIDYRELFNSYEELEDAENDDIFPPHFLIRFSCVRRSALKVKYTFLLKRKHMIKICKISYTYRQSINELCRFSVVIPYSTNPEVKSSALSSILTQKPTMRQIKKVVVPRIKAYWSDVGLFLGFEPYTISGIKEEANNDLNKSIEMLFNKWLNSSKGNSPKTWDILIHCIENVDDLTQAAEEIKEELKSIKVCICIILCILYGG